MKSKWEVIAEMQELLHDIQDLMVKDDFHHLNAEKVERCPYPYKPLGCTGKPSTSGIREDKLYQIIYDIERETCASEKCEKTCPAFPENEEYPCGVKLRVKKLTHAIAERFSKIERGG